MKDTGNPLRSRYNEGCIAAHALDLVGDRWALLVIRELMLGPKRFAAIRAGLPGISANVLTQRLGDLEAAGLVARQALPPPASVQLYGLTASGRGARPVIDALCRWGAGLPGHDPRRFISPTALMLSMAAMIDAGRAVGERFEVGFRLGAETFTAEVRDGAFGPSPGEARGDLAFAGSANAVASAIYGPRPLADAVAEGRVAFTGDIARGQAFVDLFSLGSRAQTARSILVER